MRFLALSRRNFQETVMDPLSIGFSIVFPPVLLLILGSIKTPDGFFTPQNLGPGIVLFGFALLSLNAGMLLSKDRDTELLSRLLTAPLKARDYILAYSLPYLPLILLQIVIVFGVGAIMGMDIVGNFGLALLVIIVMGIGYIGLGMVLGATFSYKTVSLAWIAVNLLTIFGGAWFELKHMGSAVEGVMKALPFAHAIEASREVLVRGATFGDIAADFWWVLIYTVVFFVAGMLLFRRRMMQ